MGHDTRNTEHPHQAVILVRTEIHQLDQEGRCMARPTSRDSETFTFTGNTHEEVKQQVEEFLGRLKNVTNKT